VDTAVGWPIRILPVEAEGDMEVVGEEDMGEVAVMEDAPDVENNL